MMTKIPYVPHPLICRLPSCISHDISATQY